jgi:hypothetical protein
MSESPTSNYIYKKALLIGVTYDGNASHHLQGCDFDALIMEKFLLNNGFEQNDITILTDTQMELNESNDLLISSNRLYKKPTRINILEEIENLANYAKDATHDRTSLNTMIVFYYSGHGSYQTDDNNDEKDQNSLPGQNDEVIVSSDLTDIFEPSVCISDDTLYVNLVKQLPSNTFLFAFFDCCHSSTMLDLKYEFLTNQDQTITYEGQQVEYDEPLTDYRVNNSLDDSECVILQINGCKDDQLSLSIPEYNGQMRGLLTKHFLAAYNQDRNVFNIIEKVQKNIALFYKTYKTDLDNLNDLNPEDGVWDIQMTRICTNCIMNLKNTSLFNNLVYQFTIVPDIPTDQNQSNNNGITVATSNSKKKQRLLTLVQRMNILAARKKQQALLRKKKLVTQSKKRATIVKLRKQKKKETYRPTTKKK